MTPERVIERRGRVPGGVDARGGGPAGRIHRHRAKLPVIEGRVREPVDGRRASDPNEDMVAADDPSARELERLDAVVTVSAPDRLGQQYVDALIAVHRREPGADAAAEDTGAGRD